MDKLESAQLQVVLPGTRASFRRRVIDAMLELVAAPASGAFAFFGPDDARTYLEATRLVDGKARAISGPGVSLSAAFGIDAKSVAASPRRAYASNELWPETQRATLPFFRTESLAHKFTHAVVLFLHEGGTLFGLAGLERREDEPPFDKNDRKRLEDLAPFAIAGARWQVQYDQRAREASALRAIGRATGALYVIDRDRKRVVWAADREHGVDWEEDVEPIEGLLVDAAEQTLSAKEHGNALPTPLRLPNGGGIAAVAALEGDPVFLGARCAVVRVAVQRPAAFEGLSKREREIARLLVSGYSGVNVAALSGLSENTVRTYVRRLYGKLGVNNRADLVRKLVSPEAASSRNPASPVDPPPDSSLAMGDDTLD
ncbi:MAG TPA: helix-turn-helix transcriptional regulator [Polyangiaceae bacterium]|nr:helix-turn-helix transcriptional regulator [Polyangiaceae bacterium]